MNCSRCNHDTEAFEKLDRATRNLVTLAENEANAACQARNAAIERAEILAAELLTQIDQTSEQRERAERAEALLSQPCLEDRLMIQELVASRDKLARVRSKVADVPDSDDHEDEFMRGVNYARREIRAAIDGAGQ